MHWHGCFPDKTVGVFHLQSPRGKYSFTYGEAEAACLAEDAALATLQQLSAAQQVKAESQLSQLLYLNGPESASLVLGAVIHLVLAFWHLSLGLESQL